MPCRWTSECSSQSHIAACLYAAWCVAIVWCFACTSCIALIYFVQTPQYIHVLSMWHIACNQSFSFLPAFSSILMCTIFSASHMICTVCVSWISCVGYILIYCRSMCAPRPNALWNAVLWHLISVVPVAFLLVVCAWPASSDTTGKVSHYCHFCPVESYRNLLVHQ